MNFNKEKKLIKKFDFFRKQQPELIKTHQDELTIFSLLSVAFILGIFTSMATSITMMCYMAGLFFGIKSMLYFQTTAENIPLKAPVTYFILAIALLALPDLLGSSSYLYVSPEVSSVPAIDVSETIPAAPFWGMP